MRVKEHFRGCTFDDFLLRPAKSRIETRKDPARKLLEMPLSRHISQKVPIVAANMDTVTEAEMMKAMSLDGGSAFLHRNCPIEKQVQMVEGVKRQHSFIIENPLRLSQDATIAEAKALTRKHKISGILVEKTAGSGILAGVLSRRDIPEDPKQNQQKIAELMTPNRSRRLLLAYTDIDVSKAEKLMHERRVEKLPLIDSEQKILGLITMKDIRQSRQKPYSTKDKRGRLFVGAAIGAAGDFLERAAELIKAQVDCILIDIAHFYSMNGEKAVKAFRQKFPDTELVCGNVATAEGALLAYRLGADAVKVGIGPGRGCRTRIETGFGVAQLEAILEVYIEVGDKIPVIADGGMRHDGDIFKAIAAGASTVMLGSILSGTDESPGIVIRDPKKNERKKIYRGSTSPQSVIGGIYDEDELAEALNTPPEGQEEQVAYQGSMSEIIARIYGHLLSSVSYSGFADLKSAHLAISKNPSEYFQKLSLAAQRESFER